jgi:hypothetical protein
MIAVETLREERAKLEGAIRAAAVKAVEDFKAATGFTPRSLDIRMVELWRPGSEHEHIVGAVTATVDV